MNHSYADKMRVGGPYAHCNESHPVTECYCMVNA